MTAIAKLFLLGLGFICGFSGGVWWARNNVSDCGEIKQPEIDEGDLGI